MTYNAEYNARAYRARRVQLAQERSNDAEWGKLEPEHRVRYVPLDELLAGVRVRALRALRWLDWANATEIALAAELADDERHMLRVMLRRAAQAGQVDKRRRVARTAYRRSDSDFAGERQYRLTPAGREWLQKRLSVRWDVATDAEAAEGRAA